ncbi:phosphoglycolate phosphatase [Sediminicurvatus halobius]|uniref:Phosphoglycolate phosphatase n=1 Tax=Sediminicurvatus halobius TaxID=2182432 RepID=A0A2U2MWN2_9GAMM|nr:phosphoglycolate phosphatase [Spiribacter halobius]PWG61268.1 phosphoglycolate phosphatase [Spiribacter halobius]UEX78423.1 phosphoglycolate phosphatase [Spiribacter halobius]
MIRPAAVLFDLDGTLVDSAPDLATAVNRTLAELGHAPVVEDTVRVWIGNGARTLMARALAGRRELVEEPPGLEAALERFFQHYRDCLVDRSRPYPGVRTGLDTLRGLGLPLGVVTNKPERFTAPLLEALDLAEYFRVLVGGDTLPVKKPDPAPLEHAARALAVPVADCLLVGDSRADLDAALAAGMPMVRVPYGYPGGDATFEDHPELEVASVDQLAARIEAEHTHGGAGHRTA